METAVKDDESGISALRHGFNHCAGNIIPVQPQGDEQVYQLGKNIRCRNQLDFRKQPAAHEKSCHADHFGEEEQAEDFPADLFFADKAVNDSTDTQKKVQEDQDKSQAAVASVRAAKLYGLDILQENINLQKHNTTRFVVISKDKVYTKDADQIALSFSLPHESGTLYNTLGHFIFNDLNMTSIESEAIIDKQWEYRFFITFEGNLSDQKVINALTGIKSETVDFKILGNYKNQS